MSGHIKKPTDQSALTNWRWPREGLVRTWKETGRARHTHQLGTAEEGTCQDMERNPLTEAHSHSGDGRGGTCQDTEKNRPTEAHSHPGDGRGRDLSEHRKQLTNQGALTSWRQQRERLVRTWKETDQPRHTHILETASGGYCQDTERNRLSEAHSPTGDSRGRDLSGHGKNPTD